MSTEIVKINDEQFGNLVHMPALYEKNLPRVVGCEAQIAMYFEPWSAIKDIKTVSFETAEAILTPLRQLRTLAADLEVGLNIERKPHTQKMAAIVSLFTDLEKRTKTRVDQIVGAENAWQLELARRAKAIIDAADKVTKNAQAKITAIAAIVQQMNTNFGQKLIVIIESMTTKFNEQTIESLPGWIGQLKKWNGGEFDINMLLPYTGESEHVTQALLDVSTLGDEYLLRVRDAITYLEDCVPGRILQLKTPNDTVGDVVRVNDFASIILADISQRNEVAQQEESRDKLNASFSAMAEPIQESAGAKGKVQKKKYLVESRHAIQAIMQSWVTYSLPLLSIEELNAKLSFMRTAAGERLNAGHPALEAPGLSVIDDIATRTQRTKGTPA